MSDISILMSVYKSEKPAFLNRALQSVWDDQSLKPDKIVLVQDGPVGEELSEVLSQWKEKLGDNLCLLKNEINLGLTKSLVKGLSQISTKYVARMDSDDISMPNRCELELNIINKNNVDIVSGTLLEFDRNVDNILNSRQLPEENEEIIKFAKSRCPFNHPCVMYKKSKVIEAGEYQDFHFLEDYYLWIRMIQIGAIGYNISTPILWMRAGSDMYKRRAGIKYVKSQNRLFKYMYKTKFISLTQYIKMTLIRTIVSLMPNGFRTIFYKVFLRK